jgi:hypothetical protein
MQHNEHLQEKLTARDKAALAQPFRSVSVVVNDSEGKLISQTVSALNQGDEFAFGIDGDGYASTKIQRAEK